MAQGEEKTESPSEFKLRQARKKGQVAKSADMNTLISLAAALFFLSSYITYIYQEILLFFSDLYKLNYADISQKLIIKKINDGVYLWLILSLPVLAIAAFGALIGNVTQFGFLLTSETLKPDIKKLNFINGFKKIFSKDRAVELIKQVIKFTIIFYIIYISFKTYIDQISLLLRADLASALIIMTNIISSIIIRIILCFLVIALCDYMYQRYSFMKSMRMSKYEVKKEYKQQEGDPHIKQERRRMHQELQESAASKNVSDASVVITNPSHVAVAIKYQDGVDKVPLLIAKGTGKLAKSLILDAHAHAVPIIRNVPLARDLQWLTINEEIPEHLYDSVAEVLIFIHELSQKNRGL